MNQVVPLHGITPLALVLAAGERAAVRFLERDALAGRVVFLEEELKTARAGAEAYRQALRGREN